ncbi:efflux RND transporter periplasmic adaptor subunit [Paraglaciecola arctica]|uniref:efflux RND transporter periplasmic adaptor subunit n=1 Tax=Paraglaciecola arctica TaxID=1128911 RepID=UPI001C0789AE|nr:efflux RND transporter periplasmic adaptor subunit [Paraglaciecola arctica]MBU3001757.1 efflux RND transporter periplasmic adaptor subunit [Paraglaciecola arctica]
MKLWVSVGVLLLLQGCSELAAVDPEKAPIVVQTFEVAAQPSSEVYEFPAVVSAVKNVELKFEVAGRLIATDLIKGRKVQKGQVLAQIDPAPYERKVKDREVRHELATNDLKRIKSLYKTGGVSQSAYDNAKTQFETTLLDLNNAKQDLSYTKITAPFDGFVSDRYIENDSYVQVGNSVATIQDRSSLYFSFDVPERVMTLNKGNTEVIATARIIGIEEQTFKIHYVEHEAIPDPITQTYNLTFAIDNAQETLLIPGSRAMVTIQSQKATDKITSVPVSAVFGDGETGFAVWLFDEQQEIVTKRKVSVNGMSGKFAIVDQGLSEGDKVVAAGITYMREGLMVREYKAEQ